MVTRTCWLPLMKAQEPRSRLGVEVAKHGITDHLPEFTRSLTAATEEVRLRYLWQGAVGFYSVPQGGFVISRFE
jgi:hypothetical protein